MEWSSTPSAIQISADNQIVLNDHQKEILGRVKGHGKYKDVMKIREIYGIYNEQSDLQIKAVIDKLARNQNETLTAHPYQSQIEGWKLDPEIFTPFQTPLPDQDNVSYYFVKEPSAFQFMMQNLTSEKVLFVDSEETGHVTGLIQISSKTQNYVVDCLSLPDEVKTELKTIFESPSILKVLHACGNDIRSINRDFQICLWPVLDTQLVEEYVSPNCRQIGFAPLLEKYTSISISKEEKTLGQLSDYRKRPLHPDVLRYAMRDTYLLNHLWHKMLETHGIEKITAKEIQDKCKKASLKGLYSTEKKERGWIKGKERKRLQGNHFNQGGQVVHSKGHGRANSGGHRRHGQHGGNSRGGGGGHRR